MLSDFPSVIVITFSFIPPIRFKCHLRKENIWRNFKKDLHELDKNENQALLKSFHHFVKNLSKFSLCEVIFSFRHARFLVIAMFLLFPNFSRMKNNEKSLSTHFYLFHFTLKSRGDLFLLLLHHLLLLIRSNPQQ